MYSLIN